MKRFLHIVRITAVALTALLSMSCLKEWLGENEHGEGFVLTVKCSEPVLTKAGMNGTIDGEARYNENKIASVDIFFYPEGGTGSNSVLHNHKGDLTADSSVDITTYTTDELIMGQLVPGNNNSFWVYVVVNYPGNIATALTTAGRGTSVSAIKKLTLNTDFSAPADHIQSSFVMDGLAHIENVEKDNRLVAKGLVNVKRLASKITLQLKIADEVSIPKTTVIDEETVAYDEVWKPMTAGMKMYLMDGVRNTTLEGLPVDNPVYFNYKNNFMRFSEIDESNPYYNETYDEEYPWITDPSYVYPQRWEYASKESPTKEPYIKLVLPWQRQPNIVNNTTLQREFYYKIVIPDDTREADANGTYVKHFVRNNWYRFLLNVAMLGSETDEATVEVDATYYVLDWENQSVVLKHAEIGSARFLSVEPQEFVLNNIADLDILYTSSHPVSLATTKGGTTLDITATKIYYGTKNAGATYGTGNFQGTVRTAAAGHPDYKTGQKYIEYSAAQRKSANGDNDWLSVVGDHIHFYHALDNDMTQGENFDTAPYIIRFKVYHEDHHNDAVYKQEVKITQYPAIYIINEQSNGKVFVNNSNSNSSITDNSGNNIGRVVDPSGVNGSGENNNQNQYTLYVTVLPADVDYMIGDPRTDGSSAVVTTLTGLNTSANYRPAAEDTQNIIAPAFKIASSYGKTSALWYNNARTRCAAYQENGYPAGRWRLPTSAEIKYLVTLSQNGIIPSLFNPGDGSLNGTKYYSYYWAGGNQAYHGDGFSDMTGRDTENWNNQSYSYTQRFGNTNYTHHSVFTRCVYDVWYWGEDKDESHLTTWGGYQTTH